MSAFEELQGKLREIFQLDRNDLDFGLYRIMNLKSQEVTKFIDNDLLPQVKEGLAKYVSNDNKSIQEELDKSIKDAKALGIDPETSPKVKELKAKLTSVFDAEKVENEIYSDLYNFFKRYYSEGDFMSLRRYKEGVYALPYEGEEVKLHWANADQYYVKSGETLTNYTFKIAGFKVRFEVIQATTEQNNNKDDKNRRFKLIDDNPVKFEHGEYVISFSYLPETGAPKQEELNKQSADVLLKNAVLMPILGELSKLTGSEKNRMTVLLKHINNFTAKSTFDYFIHKDLGKFLNRELDFYIKNEIMHLDDIDNETEDKVEQYLGKIKVLRRVARKIIQFLSSLENFQKKIWLKKKFVLETNYCITLDRVPEELYPSIVANDKQKEEWIKLFAIDEIKGYAGKLTIDFLKNNPFLVLDTAFFDTDFKYKLLASIDDFDTQCDGLLVHSENFQALSLLNEKYRESIDCIYGDPPYNAKSSEILYKNTYKHSTWLSFMCDRLLSANKLKKKKGALITAIDENEAANLLQLLDVCFPQETKNCISIVHNPAGVQGDNFSYSHEYAIFNFNAEKNIIGKTNREEESKEAFRDWGGTCSRKLAKNCFYPIYVKNDEIIGFGEVCEENFHPSSQNVLNDNGIIEVYPIGDDGEERKWVFARDSVEKIRSNLSVRNNNGVISIMRTKTETSYKTVWNDKRYYANIYGSKLLNNIFNDKVFDFPKSLYTVYDCIYSINSVRDKNSTILDYFAGSGTTGHAVINMNRDDDGKRKYILIEMGNYFDSATKPRIEKVVYSEDWKDGKPVSRKGLSHCFKYIRLESYEDTLDNLKLKKTRAQEDLLSKPQNKEIKEEYILNYMMDLETQGSLLNVSDFEHPFDYEMKITRDGETKTVKVDLVETFNYLIGLNIKTIESIRGVVAIRGRNREGENILVLWRDTTVVDNKTLDNWFEKQNYSTLDMEFDTIYVNGNNNLENLRKGDETWKVRLTEAEFLKRMFDVKDM